MRTHKILVADDSNIEADRIRQVLGALGRAEVTLVEDGAQAVRQCKNARFDMVLCDYEMPGLNGLQVVRVLRSSWSRLELPILMLTVRDDVQTKVESFRHGANDYVTKPIQAEELLARVRAHLDLKSALEENIKARMQIVEARKLETLGRLSAGVAHELNTPAQFTADNILFLQKVFGESSELLSFIQSRLAELSPSDYPWVEEVRETWQRRQLSYLLGEAPKALEESINGVMRMARIVRDLREFAGVADAAWALADVNRAIENTVAVSRHSWASSAHVSLDLLQKLPPISCDIAALKHAFYNILLCAVELAQGDAPPPRPMVRVEIRSARVGEAVEVRLHAEGPGAPESLPPAVLSVLSSGDPADASEWQGIAVAHSVALRHRGSLRGESRRGEWVEFVLSLPEGQLGPVVPGV
jgi:two-component system NtrC family sensor kinase